jgi:tetratricopeptide (TPR) repeat protein
MDQTKIIIIAIISVIFISGASAIISILNRENFELIRIQELVEKGEIDQAEEQISKFIYDNPDNVVARIVYSDILLSKGSPQIALETLIAIEEYENAKVNNALGKTYRALGQLENSDAAYSKAILSDQNFAEAYSGRSIVKLFQGDKENALKDAKKAYDLDWNNPVIVANLSVAYHFAGEISKRDDMFRKASELKYTDLDQLTKIFVSNEIDFNRDSNYDFIQEELDVRVESGKEIIDSAEENRIKSE